MAIAVEKAALGDVPAMIDDLAAVFDFRDEPAVRAFLVANTDLLPLIDEIPDRVAPYFPARERMILEVFEDPEDEDARPELFALVPTWLGPEEARQRLNGLSRDWWLNEFRRISGRMNLDVEFL